MVSRVLAIVLVTAAVSMTGALSAQRPAPQGPPQGPALGQTVQVYKSPTCGCCANWVKHLQANGFATRVTDIENLAELKARHNIPAAAQSCHTAIIDGYVLEGHVPAADVKRMLKERPAVLGLAVPGMPIGSPGMEVPNVKPSPYNVMSFDRLGQLKVYSSH